jgi:branched-chain amino acid transport system substrate-binding protein
MSKLRIHELAKELSVSSKVLIGYLQQKDLDVSSHMSSIDADTFERIRPEIESKIANWKNQGLFTTRDSCQSSDTLPPKKTGKLCNPYITGNPVGQGDAFIGRTDILKTVLNTLQNPNENGMILYGQRRIGKTSVLQRLAHTLSKRTQFIPIYFDLQDKAALSLDNLLKFLAEHILQHSGLLPFDKWTHDIQSDFQNLFIPYVLRQLPQKTSLVLLFDEFDILDSPTHDQAVSVFFPYFRNLMQLDIRLRFIFVIGRRPEDLSTVYLSLFKGVKSLHVSLLTRKETASLIRLSEQNNSLKWSDASIEKVVKLTGGHPYLTQQLCQVIWDEKNEKRRVLENLVEPQDVDPLIPKALSCATNSLEWLWDGIGPAERVVISALASSGPGSISQEELESRLQESGVRILIGELRDAPSVLEEWNLIQSSHDGIRMRVEILRLWIVDKKPLSRVREEMDRILPVAENLFQAAYRLYQSSELNETRQLLQRALGHNPNHMKANQLLAEILLAEGDLIEARKLLETLYTYNPSLARPRLIQTLLSQAKRETEESAQLALFEKVIELDPRQPEAVSNCSRLWENKGDRAFEKNDYENALIEYEKAGITEKIDQVKQTIHLNGLYMEAIEALDNNRSHSLDLLIKIISIEPTFRETSRYFHLTVTGVDIQEIEKRLESQKTITAELRKEFLVLKSKVSGLESEKKELENSTVVNERRELQERIQALEQEKLELRNLQHKLKTMIEQSVVENRKEKTRHNRTFN